MSMTIAMFFAVLTLFLRASPADAGEARRSELRRLAESMSRTGDFRDAFEAYERLILDGAATPREIEADLPGLMDLVPHTGLTDRAEKLLRRLAEERSGSWRALAAVAGSLHSGLPKDGYIVDGEFERDRGRHVSGDYANVEDRDRVEAINLMLRGEALLDDPADRADGEERRRFYGSLAGMIAPRDVRNESWRLTVLTPLDQSPRVRSGHSGWRLGWRSPAQGAPVDDEGNPVFHPVPNAWDAAENDGQRWRWALARVAGANRRGKEEADWIYASFLRDQFGVETLNGGLPIPEGDDGANPFSVRSLGDDETIAKLASGIKRFRLPKDGDYIALFRGLGGVHGRHSADALKALAEIFENRRQYAKAAETWRALRDRFRDDAALAALARITGNNGRLEPVPTLPAGRRHRIPFVFRNGDKVELAALRLDEKRFIEDIKKELRKGDAGPRWRDPERIGYDILEKDGGKYVVGKAAAWSVDLDPLPGHDSRRAHLDLPFDRAGCYLVSARMKDGNTSRIILWLSDLALAVKTAGDRRIHYVADAVSGRPVGRAMVSFFGYGIRDGRNGPTAETNEFAEFTDGDGLSIIPTGKFADLSWITAAESGDRFCFMGFDPVWPADFNSGEWEGEKISAFVMTDRPAYRPGQTIHFKAWLGRRSYDQPDASPYAGREMAVAVHNPMGEKILDGTYPVDEYGGLAGDLSLDGSAPLGEYHIQVGDYLGYGGFRLEEYRKPEFEVTVKTPDKALRLGDAASIRVEAKYYFGAPVSGGEISYKITRAVHSGTPLPVGKWDWLYGRGYWWTGYDYDWHPGWSDWGARRPAPFWLPPERWTPPELVAEGAGVLDGDGGYRITLDTAVAKAIMGDRDHRYSVEVEVADQSRRVIVGTGSVVAARKPYAVTVWTDRGYFRPGDDIGIEFAATLPEGGGMAGKGRATLYRIAYDEAGKPSEEEIDSRDIAADAEGGGTVRMRAGAPGQYRVSCVIVDPGGGREEGAVIFIVRGEKGEAGDCRFASLELTPEKREYRPGDVLNLAVGSEKKDAVVLLFPYAGRKAPQGEGPGPKVLRLEGGQALFAMNVGAAEQPNFFVEAVTIYDGKIHSEIREVFVPPAKQTLSVEVAPDSGSHPPGAPARFTVRVKDEYGRPVRGQCVVALYDRSVEYVSGGSNVGDIREHFWSWKRHYDPHTPSSLGRWGYRVVRDGDVQWQPLGIFGDLEMDWNETAAEKGSPLVMQDSVVMESALPASAPRMTAMQFSPEPAPAGMPSVAPEGRNAVMAGGTAGASMAEPAVRSEFADTALWLAVLETDSAGLAMFSLDMPENLAAWKARVWCKASGTRVGEGSAEVVTRKNVIVRTQTPRFLTQGDRVLLTANVHNYLPRPKDVRVALELEGGLLAFDAGEKAVKTVHVASGGETSAHWTVRAERPGEATVRMKALTDEESDATETKVPVIVHGARRIESFGGVLKEGEDSLSIAVRVPEARLAGESALRLSLSPTLASAMLEALPFLVEYPYGCTEQTLNRFLPALMTRRYLESLGLSLLDAGDTGGESGRRAEEWLRRFGDRRAADRSSPVFDDARLAGIVKAGVERLAGMQNADGGWGWFSGASETSWPHATAVVVYGLLKARENGIAIVPGVVESGISWLRDRQDREVGKLKRHLAKKDGAGKPEADNVDAFIYMTLAEQGHFNPDMRDFLCRDRQSLSLSAMAMLAIALREEGATRAFDAVYGNINQYVERDDESGTAWLERPSFGWWRWYNDEVETLAWYLKLLSRVDPKGDLAAAVAKHLLQNRKNGAYWRSTRDTAYAVEALADFARLSGETAPDMRIRVYYDGNLVMEKAVAPENLLDDNVFLLEGVAVETGEHVIRVERDGRGRLYHSGRLDLFSLEDPIAAAGGDLKIRREFYRLVRDDRIGIAGSSTGKAVDQTLVGYRRVRIPPPFENGEPAPLDPGDLVEVELTIDAANDCEYLVFEDMKAAGLESVELVSGYGRGNLGAYVEYRDRKVTMFLRELPRGRHNLSYRLRAETPGYFSALPAFGGGMYATDLVANSGEMKVSVGDGDGAFEGGPDKIFSNSRP